MDSTDLIRQVRTIELKTRRLVDGLFAGLYLSSFKGRGIEFDEVREYVPGDDVRAIDWNVTARTGRPFIKNYVEERELTLMLMVDISGSTGFGTTGRFKRQLEAELSATLAFSALRNNDRVGLALFSDRVERFIPPLKGRNHVLRIVRELLLAQPSRRSTDLGAALDYVNQVLKRQALLVIISDFRTGDYARPLRISARRHDVVAVQIEDPGERLLPSVGLLRLQDAETGHEVILDLRNKRVREQLQSSAESLRKAHQELFRSLGVDAVTLSTDQPYVEPLAALFENRIRRRR
ncbi:MAG: hypothetical protein KatS3mg057_2032 [Herpetosiphonaceae bacterium]|nr:MAG: hypothetical protein KatS3mg057_2032 [Herpetosiphonaceae bacterium]